MLVIFFQGTPYLNYYGGELEFKIMSMMQYDVATMEIMILIMALMVSGTTPTYKI